MTREEILENVVCTLRAKSNDHPDNIYKENYLDLDLLYVVKNEEMREEFITQEQISETGIEKEELFHAAVRNSNPFWSLNINAMVGIQTEDMLPMYGIGNEKYGASVMLDYDYLGELADMFNDEGLLILPSSIYEVIVIPLEKAKEHADLKGYLETIKAVNEEQCAENEVLSYNAYEYHRLEDTVKIADWGGEEKWEK